MDTGVRELCMEGAKGSRENSETPLDLTRRLQHRGPNQGMIATPSGAVPTEIVATTVRVVGSTTETWSVSKFVT